jgi:N-acetylglucosaminyldiphosphoundecaprenol N-acetyl-beta-D-mannosaminyltransferase
MYQLLNHIWRNKLSDIKPYSNKILINTINAHSFNIARKDPDFYKALYGSQILLPDGVGIVYALRILLGIKVKKISGSDLFHYEMSILNKNKGKCYFMGSSEKVLGLIKGHIDHKYQNVTAGYYSPPYKPIFTDEENTAIITAINDFNPDVLFIGMTAPKQEKWAMANYDKIKSGHICSIGAVFDFFAGTVKRAPHWMIYLGLEWFYRLIREPKRMWRRYVVGNSKFMFWIFKEKISINSKKNCIPPIKQV